MPSNSNTYINDLDNLARHVELPNFGLKAKLKQALLIWQPQTYDDAVTFAKQKHHFADTDSDTQLIGLLQEIRKEVSLKHTGIKQEPYSAPVQDTHANQLQQEISQLQIDMEILKESMNKPQHQYAAPLDTNSAALQQQLSKMKAEIRHSRWNALMSTPLFLEITEPLGQWTVRWFAYRRHTHIQ